MRRWRMVLAGAALIVPTFAGAAPVHAANANSLCRQVTNMARQDARESLGNVNQEFNQLRNEICKSLHREFDK